MPSLLISTKALTQKQMLGMIHTTGAALWKRPLLLLPHVVFLPFGARTPMRPLKKGWELRDFHLTGRGRAGGACGTWYMWRPREERRNPPQKSLKTVGCVCRGVSVRPEESRRALKDYPPGLPSEPMLREPASPACPANPACRAWSTPKGAARWFPRGDGDGPTGH